MSWNYRIVEFETNACGYHQIYRQIHEVYYNDDGKPESYTQYPAQVSWEIEEGDETCDEILKQMALARVKPILTPADFMLTDT